MEYCAAPFGDFCGQARLLARQPGDDGDGKSDILTSVGVLSPITAGDFPLGLGVSRINGLATIGPQFSRSITSEDAHMVGADDFNGDNLDDVVFRNYEGSGQVWFTNGVSIIGGGTMAGLGSSPDTKTQGIYMISPDRR